MSLPLRSPALTLCLAVAVALAAPAAAAAQDLAPDAPEIVLRLPADRPLAFTVAVDVDGATHVLLLEQHTVRAPGMRVRAWDPVAGYTEVDAPAIGTYRGEDLTVPGSAVVASLGPRGLTATVLGGDHPDWRIEPAGFGPGAANRRSAGLHDPRLDLPPMGIHRVGLLGASAEAFTCEALLPGASGAGGAQVPGGGGSGGAPAGGPSLGAPAGSTTGALTRVGTDEAACQFLAEIAFDADFEFHTALGATVAGTVARIESHLNEVDFFYARDVGITYALGEIVVRTAPFYTPTGGGDLLDQFRAEWRTTLADVPRDIAHLMTGMPGSLIEFGGLAYVGVVCSFDWMYGWSMDSAGIVGHEVGHNWNAPHCLDPTPCNAMCGACLFHGPVTKGVIEQHRNTRDCLDRLTVHPTPLPPYAMGDAGPTVRKDEFAALGPVPLDVLANDEDGNCGQQPLIAGFDPTSERGATIALVPGGGAGGADALSWTGPASPFVGTDRFEYVSGDVTGQAATGEVTLQVRALELHAAWPLDEGAGSDVADATPTGLDGTTAGAPTWIAGVHGGALSFDGVDDEVVTAGTHLTTDEFTAVMWMRRDGNPSFFASPFAHRGGSSPGMALRWGVFGGLTYDWPGGSFWASGIEPPDGQWVLVALVIEPSGATIHMHDGVALQSSTHATALQPAVLDGNFTLGADPTTLPFRGDLDEVRVYDFALTPAEVTALATTGGPAEAPLPVDGGAFADPDGLLRWLPSPQAVSHDVFVGADAAAVESATLASPEYRGSTAGASFDPGPVTAGAELFWRVDTNGPAGTTPGRPWQFLPPTAGRWTLDETGGDVAFDSVGGHDADLFGGPSQNQAGSPAGTGTSYFFDGVDDRARIPALDLHTDTLTLTAWVRRDGDLKPWAGIVHARDGSTIAGLNVGDLNELRYHWDGGQWGWNPGLVLPDDTWTFVALVVEPTQATLYMSENGELLSATNVSGHAVEAFDGTTLIARDKTGDRYFRGWIDDVRLYDAALTPAQVAAIGGF